RKERKSNGSARLLVRSLRPSVDRLRHLGWFRPGRGNPASGGPKGRRAAHSYELHRPPLGRQRGLARHLRRRPLPGLSPRLPHPPRQILPALHVPPFLPHLSGSLHGVSKQKRIEILEGPLGFFLLRGKPSRHLPLRRRRGKLHAGPSH